MRRERESERHGKRGVGDVGFVVAAKEKPRPTNTLLGLADAGNDTVAKSTHVLEVRHARAASACCEPRGCATCSRGLLQVVHLANVSSEIVCLHRNDLKI